MFNHLLLWRLNSNIGILDDANLVSSKEYAFDHSWKRQRNKHDLILQSDRNHSPLDTIRGNTQYDSRVSMNEITSAKLVGKCGVVLDGLNKIILRSTLGSKNYVIKSGDAKWIFLHRFIPAEEIELGISLVGQLSQNYFHWLMDYLPVLEYWQYYIDLVGVRPKVITNSHLTNFQKQYLHLLGVKESDIVPYNKKKLYVKKLLLAPNNFKVLENDQGNKFYLYARKGSDWLREKLMREESRAFPNYLFIVRRESSRKILNQEELEVSLFRFGFTLLYLDEISVKEQIGYFKNAKIIIGVHGAGLTNLVFSCNASVIELYPKTRKTSYSHLFYQISTMYDHRHYIIDVESTENQQVTVNVADVEIVLKKCFNELFNID